MKFYKVLPPEDAMSLASTARKLSWDTGKARTDALTGTVKQNEEILSNEVLETIGQRIVSHHDIQLDAIPKQMHKPKFSRYKEGARYQRHTDAPWMGDTRTDLSCTLWLSSDYDGGELVINGEAFRG